MQLVKSLATGKQSPTVHGNESSRRMSVGAKELNGWLVPIQVISWLLTRIADSPLKPAFGEVVVLLLIWQSKFGAISKG